MKQLLVIICLLMSGIASRSQSMSDFFQNHGGVQDVGYCAHLTNDFNYGNYDIESNYVLVEVHFKDVNLDDEPITTKVTLSIDSGILPFDGIQATYDNDYVDPFVALELGCWYIQRLIEKSSPEQYNRTRQAMIQLLGTDPNNWSGADWALFAMNLAYLDYYTSR